MRFFLAYSLLMMLAVQPAHASVACNEHGAVVTLDSGDVYYLGKTCDAARPGGASGRWWLSASAYVVAIDGQFIRIPFDIDCDLPYCVADG